jgi:ribokinase
MTVVVVGDLMTDVVAWASGPLAHASDTPAQITTHPGGGGANVAAWLAACGVPTLLVARAGNDIAGRTAVAELQAEGVQTRVAIDPIRATGTVVVIVEPTGERTMLPDRAANAALAPADLPVDELRAATHLHLSGYTLLDPGSRAAGLVALEHAREAGISVSVDPASAAPIEAAGPRAFLDWVANADMLLPNLEEAMALTGARGPEAAAWALASGGRDVVITLGAGGALWSDGEQVVRAAAAEAPAPVDSTGAGDAFTAGWLAARLDGAEPAEALAAANELAAGTLRDAGAR